MKTPRRAMNGVACLLVVLGGINGINAQLPSHHHGGSFHVSFTSEGPGRKLADRETPRRPVGEAVARSERVAARPVVAEGEASEDARRLAADKSQKLGFCAAIKSRKECKNAANKRKCSWSHKKKKCEDKPKPHFALSKRTLPVFQTALSNNIPIARVNDPIHHVHIAKMAGRTVMYDFPSWSHIQKCYFQPQPFFGHISNEMKKLSSHCNNTSCFYSYEANFDDFQTACPSAFKITLLRHPMNWLVSAVSHYGQTLDSIIAAPASPKPSPKPADEASPAPSPKPPSTDDGRVLSSASQWYGFNFPMKRLCGNRNPPCSVDDAVKNVFSMAFGIVEYFEESKMLLLYQTNRVAEAKLLCDKSESVKSNGYKPDDTKIAHDLKYGQFRYEIDQLSTYAHVYDACLVEFFRRYRQVYNTLCLSMPSSIPDENEKRTRRTRRRENTTTR